MLHSKKAQFESALLAVITIFVIGIILFFFNHVNNELYTSLDKYFNSSNDYNQSEAHTTVTDIQEVDNAVWDWAFLAIFMGVMLNMLFFSFATRINIAFYWIFAILGIIILVIGTVLSNIWQEMAANPEFSGTILRFPITNTLLGSYFPTVIVAITLVMMIVLFGKPPSQIQ